MYFWYKLTTCLFYPFASIFLIFRKFKKKEHPSRYKEKLAKIDTPKEEGILIWLHAASIGETLSVLPLIENLEQNKNIKKILITTITLSSAELIKKKINKNTKIIHQFLPLDIPKFVDKFLNHWSPNLAIFVDSEIWPNFIFKIKKRKIPLLLVNGRITKKTFSKWKYLNNFAQNIFQKFDLCLVANSETEKRLHSLGANNIKNFGNLKFTNTKINTNNQIDELFLEKLKNRKIWCAASTHPTEEIFCAETHLDVKKSYKDVLTVIIPRHVNRTKLILKELSSLNLKVCLYSNIEQIKFDTDVLLVDAYGESLKFFNIAKCVFLGGSLIKHGGQNPVEASRLGCKIFHGPNVDNFNEIYKYLESLGASKKINNYKELVQSVVEEFKSNTNKNDSIKKDIEKYGDNILNQVIEEIKKYINI